MNIRTLVSCSLAALVACLPAAHAERITNLADVQSDDPFVGYMFGAETNQALRDFSARWDRNMGQACAGPYTVDMLLTRVTLLQPIDTPTQGKPPVEGLWQYQFTAQRCGKAKVFNTLVMARKDKEPLYIGLVPGQTQADPNLIRDTLGQLELGAKAEVKAKGGKACKDFAVMDTLVQTPAAPKGERFEERWVLRYCGEERTVPVCFSPKAEGGMSLARLPCAEVERLSQPKSGQ
jgi:hypothetical protein